MTSMIDAPTLEDSPVYDDWVTPETLSAEQNDAICAGLEALFHLPVDDDKRDYPYELSALIKAVYGEGRLTFGVLAGDGSLMAAFDPAYCFGIEPEEKRSRRRQGRYQTLVGTLPRISKLLDPIHTELGDIIVDLREEEDGEEILNFVNANWAEGGYTVFIDHGDENAARLAEIPGIYAQIVLGAENGEPDMSIYFGLDPNDMKKPLAGEGESYRDGPISTDEARPEGCPSVRHATIQTLDLLAPWVQEQRTKHTRGYINRRSDVSGAQSYMKMWKATHREYGRRFLRDVHTYDIELVGRTVLNYLPSDWTKYALEATAQNLGDLGARIHKREISTFAQNSGLWRELLILADEGILLIDPLVDAAVEPIIEMAERASTPLRPLKEQEKLGYLGRQSKIKCIVDDPESGFVAGKWYSVSQGAREYGIPFTKHDKWKGILQLLKKKRRYYHQQITVGTHQRYYDDDPTDIAYLLKHFIIPDPGNVESRYPELFAAEEARYDQIQEEYLTPRGLAFKPYQKRDLSAISISSRNILAHEQGLGKSIEGLAFGLNAQLREADPSVPVLIICPQDLIPQWQAEAKKFYGIDLQWIGRHKSTRGGKSILVDGEEANISGGAIKNIMEARDTAQKIRDGHGGWYITHYEALTLGGAKNLQKIEDVYTIRIDQEEKFVKGGWRTDKDTGRRMWFESEMQTVEKEITTAMECPECGSALFGRPYCGAKHLKHPTDPKHSYCTWNRYVYRLPSIGQILSTAFKKGVIVVDEGTQIASARQSTEANSSQKTKAVVGMRSRYRLLMSGTPVKNFIAQAYWLLWWSVGGKEKGEDGRTRWSTRFPYAYHGGKESFASEYTVIETTYNEETSNWVSPKEVGEVTNTTQLWAQLASVLLRRTKEETGELIPKKEIHVVHSPLGYYQREQMDFWLANFPKLYAEKQPDDPKVKSGIHELMAPMLGLDVKLNYASVLPKTDQDWAWTTVPVSNFTPASYRALTTVMSLVKQGRKVLVGTDIKAASGWLAAQLTDKGVNCRTMLKPNSNDTLDPPDRSKVVAAFQNGEIDVLVSTMKAIRLGHNLDQGSAVVLFGLDWDYETYAQFRDRVHRLTSENPIDVYVVISGEENRTMLGRKWDVIKDKEKGASMALDGYIPEQNEIPPNIAEIVAKMMEEGIPATGDEIMESAVRKAWGEIPRIEQYKIPEGFADDQAKPWIIDWAEANAAYERRLAVVAEWEAEEAEIAEADFAALTELLTGSIDKGVCESLEGFFAGATAPLPDIVPDVTSDFGGEISPTTESGESSPVGGVVPAGPGGDVSTETSEDSQSSSEMGAADGVHEGQLSMIQEEPVKSGSDTAPAPPVDYMGQLKQAKELHELGVLDDEEFADLKATLIAGLKAAT